MTNRNVLYRIFDGDGALLYIGATTSLATRIASHAQTQPWWDEASEIKLKRFETFEELAKAEVLAIEFEHPKYNVLHSKPPVWAWKPRGRRGDGSLFQRADGVWIGRIEVGFSPNGQRRRKTVSSRDRATAQRRLDELKASLGL